ncbi:MAG: DNA polymerase II [Treponema sp.]|jgi:DNA polymerase-2|nr:DNA polymerase II [Treponema sp.]
MVQNPCRSAAGNGAEGLALFRGFLVHCYADLRRDRLYCVGRLADGRSFAAVEERWRPCLHIYDSDRIRALPLLAGLPFEEDAAALESFSGAEKLCRLRFSRYGDRARAVAALENAGIPSPDRDAKPADLFLMEKQIRGPLEIRGRAYPGRRVDLIIRDGELLAPGESGPGGESGGVSLRLASIDIETDVRTGVIRAAALALAGESGGGQRISGGLARVWMPGAIPAEAAGNPAGTSVAFHPDEKSLLAAFIDDLRRADPDVLTGWNILDFDLARLSDRCVRLGVPFLLGRSGEAAKYFSGEASGKGRRSAAALIPGRQALDALRVVRSGSWGRSGGLGGEGGPSGYSLEAVSQAVLREGKTVHSSGEEKIAELDRLYAADPKRFGEYCYRDAELVLRILDKTGFFRLTRERAALTGVSLDKAWTSVASFERIYGMELRRRGIAPPPLEDGIQVSGAAGGTVLEPRPGLFYNVAVFDFRSLYPTIIRTFNIDPLSHARAARSPGPVIRAPNGAAFSRQPGVLPALIADYFAARRTALERGDETAAHVYKILMNSFYGVLGTGACRYGRTDLAGAITSFARKWLLLTRDWFAEQGFSVLYGDTDSLFVETGLGDAASYRDFAAWGGRLAAGANRFLGEKIREAYQLESFIELRFEKAYRRVLIPPLRNTGDDGENRGRAKGYGGYLLQPEEKEPAPPGTAPSGGALRVEVKGMEAVRSDSTPLARRLQLELLELVFSGAGEAAFQDRVRETLKKLRRGELDGELVYRKRLSRPPETYTASTPPQVKAARALGWKNRRGTVEYVWTQNGAEPAALSHAPLDYDHYALAQVLPVAQSIAAAAHWASAAFESPEGQMELDL